MMQSSYGGGGGGAGGSGDEDDDMFAPNPFRTGSNDSDLLGTTPNNVQQQQQQPQMMMQQPQQQQPYMQQQQQPPQQQQQYMPQQQQQPGMPLQQHQQQQQIIHNYIPDPNSGMTGSLTLPPPSQAHPYPQQQQQQQLPQAQMATNPALSSLSGTMDQNASNNYGSNDRSSHNNNANRGPASIFSWRFWTWCVRLETYQTYFDMDTVDIQARLRAALVDFYKTDHFRCQIVGHLDSTEDAGGSVPPAASAAGADDSTSSPLYHKGPDLYGPVWISMTLVFLLAVTSNMAAYYQYASAHRKHEADTPSSGASGSDGNSTEYTPPAAAATYEQDVETFEYDLTHLIRALSVVTTFAWILPTIFWFAATCLGLTSSRNRNDLTWIWWICCYGYSLTPFVAATFLAWLPFGSWIFMIVATVMSGLLVLRNLSTPLLEGGGGGANAAAVAAADPSQDPQQQQVDHQASKAAPLIFFIPAAHFILGWYLKISFYSHSSS